MAASADAHTEVAFLRLLHRCEAAVSSKNGVPAHHLPKFAAYLDLLQQQLKQLRSKANPSGAPASANTSRDPYKDYSRRVKYLAELVDVESLHNRTRLGPLNSALFPTSAAAVPDPMSSSATVTARGSLVAQPLNMADAQLRADSRLQTAQKERLLKKSSDTPAGAGYGGSGVVRRRGTAGQSNDVEDDEDSRLHDSLEDERLQKEAVADMFNMSETLKANALAISAALETDDKVVDTLDDAVGANLGATQRENERLKKHIQSTTTGTWFMYGLLVIMGMVFMGMFFFMKLFKKPR